MYEVLKPKGGIHILFCNDGYLVYFYTVKL